MITEYSQGRVVINVDGAEGGVLVLSDVNYPTGRHMWTEWKPAYLL